MSRRKRLTHAAAVVLFATLAVLLAGLVKSVGCTDSKPQLVLPKADGASLSLARAEDGGALRSPGCGKPAPVAPGVLVGTGGGRTFHVFPPRGYDPNAAYPVLFTYHGIDSNGGQFEEWFKMEDHVNGEAIVVYPDARKASYGGTAWELAGERDMIAFDDMRSAVAQSFCVDLTRIYAMGFSYGGKFVTALACMRPGILRAISSNDASWGNANEATCAAIPVLVTHRTNDPDELLEWGRSSAEAWARVNGCEGPKAVHATDEAHGCADYSGCRSKVTFCEDRYANPSWRREWNHTVREEYRDLVWRWLRER
jgi:poly(3-hydroxybutyrate) depolymerase